MKKKNKKPELNNLFITLEGIDGSGKSTIIKKLATALEEKTNKEVVVTKEPGATELGKEIRKGIMDHDISKKTELLLFLADRQDHLEKVIQPALKEKKIVLCDRYADSTIAYQANNDNDFVQIVSIDRRITNFEPHLTLFIDISVEESIKRIRDRGALNRMDKMSISEKIKIRDNYVKLSKLFPERVKVINGENPPEKVLSDIMNEIYKEIPELRPEVKSKDE